MATTQTSDVSRRFISTNFSGVPRVFRRLGLFLCGVGLVLTLESTPAKAQFLDCSCLQTQAVLFTGSCTGVIPDLCLVVTNCWIPSVGSTGYTLRAISARILASDGQHAHHFYSHRSAKFKHLLLQCYLQCWRHHESLYSHLSHQPVPRLQPTNWGFYGPPAGQMFHCAAQTASRFSARSLSPTGLRSRHNGSVRSVASWISAQNLSRLAASLAPTVPASTSFARPISSSKRAFPLCQARASPMFPIRCQS